MKMSELKKTEKNLAAEITETLIGYVKTQFLVVAIVTAVSGIVLSVLGVRYALLLAFLTGAFSTVPLIGMTVAAVITAAVAVFDGVRFLTGLPPVFEGVAVLFIYFLMNQLTDFFLAPYLIGKVTKLHPVLVLFSIIIGTWLLGIPGAVLAVPALLTVRVVLKHYG